MCQINVYIYFPVLTRSFKAKEHFLLGNKTVHFNYSMIKLSNSSSINDDNHDNTMRRLISYLRGPVCVDRHQLKTINRGCSETGKTALLLPLLLFTLLFCPGGRVVGIPYVCLGSTRRVTVWDECGVQGSCHRGVCGKDECYCS